MLMRLKYAGSLILFLACAYCVIVAQLSITELSNTSIPAFGLASSIENHFFDLRSKSVWKETEKSPNLAILSIDEESIKKIGRWPWSRAVFATVVDKLRQLDAKAVFLDVLFAEPELACSAGGKAGTPADDALAQSVKSFSSHREFSQVIVGYGLTDNPQDALAGDVTSQLFASMLNSERAPKTRGLGFIDKNNFVLPSLIDAGVGLGFINGIPDSDGVYRHSKIISSISDVPVPSGGLALFQSYYRRKPSDFLSLRPAEGLENVIAYGSRQLRVDSFGQLRIRYLGGPERFRRYSLHELYDADLSRPELARDWRSRVSGKAVLIGSEAMGAHDLRHTPVDPNLPGLYLHANIFHMFDQNYFFQESQANINVSFLLLCLGVALATLVGHLQSPVLEVIFTGAFVGAVVTLDGRYFLPRGYHLSLFFVCLGALGCYAWGTFLGVLREIRERRRVRSVFGHYVSDKIVNAMLGNPDLLKLGGERREITMFFSDIRGFSSIGETLSPQDLAFLLNLYMTRMVEVLFAFDGTLERFVGDGMVAFWSAPIVQREHAFAAVGCAIRMLEALPAINAELTGRGLPAISIGIGLNTGQVAVGNMGSDKIFSYTAHGDAMNLASRLEGMTKFYGAGIVISEFVLNHLGTRAKEFPIRPLDRVRVKGRESPVAIHEVLSSLHPLARDSQAFASYRTAYELYSRRDFSGAVEVLEKIVAKHDDPASVKLLERARRLVLLPPAEGWDGVTHYESK